MGEENPYSSGKGGAETMPLARNVGVEECLSTLMYNENHLLMDRNPSCHHSRTQDKCSNILMVENNPKLINIYL